MQTVRNQGENPKTHQPEEQPLMLIETWTEEKDFYHEIENYDLQYSKSEIEGYMYKAIFGEEISPTDRNAIIVHFNNENERGILSKEWHETYSCEHLAEFIKFYNRKQNLEKVGM
jgi:hypothetical protein